VFLKLQSKIQVADTVVCCELFLLWKSRLERVETPMVPYKRTKHGTYGAAPNAPVLPHCLLELCQLEKFSVEMLPFIFSGILNYEK